MLRITPELLKARISGRLAHQDGATAPAEALSPSLLDIPDDEAFLNEAYRHTFGRDIDLDAFLWLSRTLQCSSRKLVVDSLYESPEAAAFAHRFGGPVDLTRLLDIGSDTTFVKAAYLFILRRAADQSDVEHYVQRLAQGAARLEVAANMAASEASKALGICYTANGAPLPVPDKEVPRESTSSGINVADLLAIAGREQFVQTAYLRILRREADPPGLAHWLERLNRGASRAGLLVALAASGETTFSYHVNGVPLEVAARVLNSLPPPPEAPETDPNQIELAHLCDIPSDIEFLRAAYLAILNRTAEDAGLQFNLGLLENGITRERILARLVWSEEAQSQGRRFVLAGFPVPASPATRLSAGAAAAIDIAGLLSIAGPAEFIAAAYLRMRGHPVDEAGLRHWSGRIAQGISHARVLLEMAATPELTAQPFSFYGVSLSDAAAILERWPDPVAPDRTEPSPLDGIPDPGEFLFSAYRQILGRQPDFEGFAGYWTLEQTGYSRQKICALMAASPEAAARQGTHPVPQPDLPFGVRLRVFLARYTGGRAAAAHHYAICGLRHEMRVQEQRRGQEERERAELSLSVLAGIVRGATRDLGAALDALGQELRGSMRHLQHSSARDLGWAMEDAVAKLNGAAAAQERRLAAMVQGVAQSVEQDLQNVRAGLDGLNSDAQRREDAIRSTLAAHTVQHSSLLSLLEQYDLRTQQGIAALLKTLQQTATSAELRIVREHLTAAVGLLDLYRGETRQTAALIAQKLDDTLIRQEATLRTVEQVLRNDEIYAAQTSRQLANIEARQPDGKPRQ